jgi:hypothetical protein
MQKRTKHFGIEGAEARGKAEHANAYEVERIRVDFHITLLILVFSLQSEQLKIFLLLFCEASRF